MRPREIRRRCKRVIRTLRIPDPFDVRQLCATIARSRGRPIELRPMAMPPRSPSGIWLATGGHDYILYERNTTALHQEHIITHELGHLLTEDGGVSHPGSPLLGFAMAQILPDLDAQMVRRMLARTAYSDEQEQVAETIATMILEVANRWQPRSEWTAPADGADLRRRIHLTVEPSAPRWRL
jgi:hypothetical protein